MYNYGGGRRVADDRKVFFSFVRYVVPGIPYEYPRVSHTIMCNVPNVSNAIFIMELLVTSGPYNVDVRTTTTPEYPY